MNKSNRMPPQGERMFKSWDDAHEARRLKNAIEREKQKVARWEKDSSPVESGEGKYRVVGNVDWMIKQSKRMVMVFEARLREIS